MSFSSSSSPPPLSSLIPKLTPRPHRRSKQPPSSAPPSSSPVPSTPPLPSPPAVSPHHRFIHPTRRILTKQDHDLFLSSPTYSLLLAFIFSLSDAVRDTPISTRKTNATTATTVADDEEISPVVRKILRVLDQVEAVLKTCPAEDQAGSRFGNVAFRTFLDRVSAESGRWLKDVLGDVAGVDEEKEQEAMVDEVGTYLLESFGNRTRIDYGSGHELNFMVWLLCLYQLRLIVPSDFPAVVLNIFTRYLTLMRLIQSTYYLEPAGSHGVWGLDDYQFLPFLFGASQLMHHPYIRPLSIHQPLILEQYASQYLYLGQVAFVVSVKNVEGLRWHSPMLDDISAAKSWEKVEGGMRRMFVAEVLKKLPVMQHFLFGSLVPAVEGMSVEQVGGVKDEQDDTATGGEVAGTVVMQDGMEHVHQNSSWGDCCGIKVPSSIGAAEEMKKKTGGERLRRVPFD